MIQGKTKHILDEGLMMYWLIINFDQQQKIRSAPLRCCAWVHPIWANGRIKQKLSFKVIENEIKLNKNWQPMTYTKVHKLPMTHIDSLYSSESGGIQRKLLLMPFCSFWWYCSAFDVTMYQFHSNHITVLWPWSIMIICGWPLQKNKIREYKTSESTAVSCLQCLPAWWLKPTLTFLFVYENICVFMWGKVNGAPAVSSNKHKGRVNVIGKML